MTIPVDVEVLEAFERLLARPDPQGLPRRALVHRCDGEPNRRVTRLPHLVTAWLQYRYLACDEEELPTLAMGSLEAAPSPRTSEWPARTASSGHRPVVFEPAVTVGV